MLSMTIRSPWHLPIAVLLTLFLPLLFGATASAADDGEHLWADADAVELTNAPKPEFLPTRYRVLGLDRAAMAERLATAPLENDTDIARSLAASELLLSLPLPEGGFTRFRVVESPIMEPGLAARFPEIKTYRGQGVDEPASTVRFDLTPAGFHAQILSPSGRVYIDPYGAEAADLYVSYFARDANRAGRDFTCGVTGHDTSELVAEYRSQAPNRALSGATLRTYRLAVAATGEYTAFHGGTVPLGQAAIVTAINRVDGIYEQEVAIRMVLVAGNNLLVYTNAATDPYSNDNGSAMLGQNQTNIDTVIGSANYDIGHVFSTGGGGVAFLGVPCTASKARGVTGLGAPIGDNFWVDYVAHEMGHQWGGNHTFNGSEGSCSGGNRNGPTAFEPGSGSTIQAYAGICGSQNLQAHSDPYFHGISLDEIIAYSTTSSGDNCDVPSATGNNPPSVDAGAAYTVPLETPFELCGGATDPDMDDLTFAWEEFDLGAAGAPDMPVGNAPIFRSFNPTTSPCRTFPRLADLASGTLAIGELRPTYARTMNFRLTARDNRSGGGGVADDATTVTVSDAAGPFLVTAPNTATSLAQGSMTTVTWDVASTDQAPINCATVDITLSDDGGLTFPTILAASVANSGSQLVTLPGSPTAAARVQVRCATSIFFDISDVDFGIGVPQVAISAPTDGSTVVSGDSVTFTGTASDPEDGDLSASLSWSSSLDGAIGSGASFAVSDLSLGTHTITAEVDDSQANHAEASLTLHVEPGCDDLVYSAGYETSADGWVGGVSTCSTGAFIRGTPDEVSAGEVTTQPAGAATGTFAWFTANNAGGAGTDDVDGGTCETLSPVVAVGAGSEVTVFTDYFHGQRDAGGDPDDGFSIELVNAATGLAVATLVDIGDQANDAVWTTVWQQLVSPAASVRLRVRATDGLAAGDLVEGGLDNIRICVGIAEDIFADGFESGSTSAWSAAVP